MAAPCYIMWNGATGGNQSAALAGVPTGTALKTMMQLKPGTPKVRIIEWGYSFEAVPSAMVRVELIETGTVGATFAATVTAGTFLTYNDVTGPPSQAQSSTANSAWTNAAAANTSEGTITTSRLLAYQEEWGQQFKQQFPLGREPEINGGSYLRIRATTATAINMSCYVIWEE